VLLLMLPMVQDAPEPEEERDVYLFKISLQVLVLVYWQVQFLVVVEPTKGKIRQTL